MDQSRHNGVGIEFEVGRIELITAQSHQSTPPRKSLLLELNPNFFSTYRIDGVVKLKHAGLSLVKCLRLATQQTETLD